MNNEYIDHEARLQAKEADEKAQRALDRLVTHERQCSLMWRAMAGAMALLMISWLVTHAGG